MQKNGQFGDFLKSQQCYQTIVIEHNLMKNAKIEKFQCNILAFKVSNLFFK